MDDIDRLLEEAKSALAPMDAPKRRRSGGPRSESGKAIAAGNSIKHGAMSQEPVLPSLGETLEGWLALRDGIVEALAPVGAMEQALAERVALNLQRLRRAERAERALIMRQEAHERRFAYTSDVSEDTAATIGAITSGPRGEHLLRYETAIWRQTQAALAQLDELQRARSGKPIAAARLTVMSNLQNEQE